MDSICKEIERLEYEGPGRLSWTLRACRLTRRLFILASVHVHTRHVDTLATSIACDSVVGRPVRLLHIFVLYEGGRICSLLISPNPLD